MSYMFKALPSCQILEADDSQTTPTITFFTRFDPDQHKKPATKNQKLQWNSDII